MTDAPDARLLEQFVRNSSEEAFAALVQRHIGLVHSVALRHTANPQHAEDLTQAVFIILARKAVALGRRTVLPGWLYHTARLAAANWQRAEARRVRREQEAFMQSTLEEPATDALWQALRPQLDEAMAVLGAGERDALVLRYFQNKSMAEVGRLLGLAENTAQKRVGRALEKLRKFFAKRGVDSTAAGLAETISTYSVHPVSAALAESVTVAALAKGVVAGSSTLTLVKGALKIMAWTKAKTAVIGVAVVGIAAVSVVQYHAHVKSREQLRPRRPAPNGLSTTLATAMQGNWAGDVAADQAKLHLVLTVSRANENSSAANSPDTLAGNLMVGNANLQLSLKITQSTLQTRPAQASHVDYQAPCIKFVIGTTTKGFQGIYYQGDKFIGFLISRGQKFPLSLRRD